jgi:hypothetical protein
LYIRLFIDNGDFNFPVKCYSNETITEQIKLVLQYVIPGNRTVRSHGNV